MEHLLEHVRQTRRHDQKYPNSATSATHQSIPGEEAANTPRDSSSKEAKRQDKSPKKTLAMRLLDMLFPLRSTKPKPEGFLALPPELRNQIYRLALLRPDRIDLANYYVNCEPGLLSASKQIRAEASGIYWLENAFAMTIRDFDSTLNTRFHMANKKSLVRTVPICMLLQPSRNWANLKVWLRDFYLGRARSVGRLEHEEDTIFLLGFVLHLFDVVRRRKAGGASWREIEGVLEDVKRPVVLLHPAWERRERRGWPH